MAAAEQPDLCRDCWVLEQIQFCIKHRLNSLLLIEPACELVIDGKTGRYAKRLARTVTSKWSLSRGMGQFSLRHSTLKDDDPSIQEVRSKGRPLDELLWQCAWKMSNGRLLPGCRRDDVVQLKSWPNLTRVSSSANSMKIAALLSARPTSLGMAARLLNISEREVFQFYSAARYAGIVETIHRDDKVITLRQGKRRNLAIIRRLLRHMESLQQGRTVHT